VGWSTLAASLDLGTDGQGFGFGGTGKKSHRRQFDSYGQEYGLGDVIGCWLDAEAGELGFMKNGVDLGVAFQLPPFLKGQVG
jgi:ATP-dependent RNA helicase DDX1